MLQLLLLAFSLCSFLNAFAVEIPTDSFDGVPVAFQGRFREASAYADLWWYNLYHSTKIKKKDSSALNAATPSDLLWKIHFLGHHQWDRTPIFWIDGTPLKNLLGLRGKTDHLSYDEIKTAKEQSVFLRKLVYLEFSKRYFDTSNRSHSKKFELKQLSPGLWVGLTENGVDILESDNTPWKALGKTTVAKKAEPLTGEEEGLLNSIHSLNNNIRLYEELSEGSLPEDEKLRAAVNEWKQEGLSNKEIAQKSDEFYPLNSRLKLAGNILRMLPSKKKKGEWLSLEALRVVVYSPETKKLEPVKNFTVYDDALFENIRSSYMSLRKAVLFNNNEEVAASAKELGELLRAGYAGIAGSEIQVGGSKPLYYPTILQLKAEAFYYKAPLIEISLSLYVTALCLFLLTLGNGFGLSNKKIEFWATLFLLLAFAVHTIIIALRCYILSRPPVSNMFETVIYVPWIAVLSSLLLRPFLKTTSLFIGSSLTAIALLTVLKVSAVNSSLENVQAVLDSQYWLIIHVMMIVGSYGVFALSGILAHIYISGLLIQKKETPWLRNMATCILQTLYVGVALLIPGTILGGVWAAQSWGRFWDWDPKESWAFISSCVYLIGIHAFRFGHIKNFGLAIASIFGLMAISFTWYGVNYLLGTGLHSYGFGSGGDLYYYLYLLGECLFLLTALFMHKIL